MLYSALFLPYLDYCCEVWGTAYKSSLHCLQVCQRKAVRIITRSDRRAPSTPLFYKLHLLKFDDIVKIKICTVMFRGKMLMLPANLQDRLMPFSSLRRNNRIFPVPYARTVRKKQCIMVIGPKLFNDLPALVHGSKNVLSFKSRVKFLFLQQYNCND